MIRTINTQYRYKDGVYNKAVFIPQVMIEDIKKSIPSRKFTLSKHARQRMFRKSTISRLESGKVEKKDLVGIDKIKDGEIVEVYIRDGYIVKYVIRIPANKSMDYCLVVDPTEKNNFIVTMFTNSNNDVHKTTDISKYQKLF